MDRSLLQIPDTVAPAAKAVLRVQLFVETETLANPSTPSV